MPQSLHQRLRLPVATCLLALVVTMGTRLGRADGGPDDPPQHVRGVVYEVFHGDSIHVRGIHIREIHVPESNLAFYVARGELRVFRPESHRYRLPGETIAVELPGGEVHRLPVLAIPGTETRRVGEVRLRREDVERLEALLRQKIRLRLVADTYLRSPPEAEPPGWQLDRASIPPTPVDTDVLTHLQRFPGTETVTADGQKRQPRYGELALEQSERVLEGRLPRPWTVGRLMRSYQQASEGDSTSPLRTDTRRAALLYLLAASRRAEALPLVGTGLADPSLEVRVAATEGVLTYWDPEGFPEGGTEQAMLQAEAWWDSHRR